MQDSPFNIHNKAAHEEYTKHMVKDVTERGIQKHKPHNHEIAVKDEHLDKHVQMVEKLVNYLKQSELGVSKLDACKNPPITDVQIYKDIIEGIPEINDKIKLFCRSTSQTSRRLVTPIMMNASNSPYRTLKQILAQIEDVKSKVLSFVNADATIANELKNEIVSTVDAASLSNTVNKYTKKQISLYRQYPYLESMLRELYTLIESYYEVKRNKNIPDDWDELDFEKDEIKSNLGLGFRNGIKDIMQTGRVSGSTMELFEGLGVSPFECMYEINTFFNASPATPYTYEQYNAFIDAMCEKYKDHYEKALSRLGLDSNFLHKATSRCIACEDETLKLK